MYERTFENIYGCDSVVILNLTVIGEPRLSINAPFTTVCAGASDVPVTATVSYLEGIDNATTLSFTNEETSRDTTNGIVTVSYETSFSELLNSTTLTAQSVNTANGVTCSAVDTVEITVIPVDSIATLTASVCQGEAFDRDDEWSLQEISTSPCTAVTSVSQKPTLWIRWSYTHNPPHRLWR